jgi:AcrR family transcriptional regulator
MNTPDLETMPCRPSMKERQRQYREDAILDTAIEFLQTKGFNAMTLEDITESIGISRPTLYQHFSSKEEMVMQVVLRNLLRGIAKIQGLDPALTPLERLEEFLDYGMQSRFGSCKSIFTDIAHVVNTAKAKNECYRTAEAQFKELFSNLILAAQEAGQVRNDIRPRILAETVMAIYKCPSFDELIQVGKVEVGEIRHCIFNLLKPCGS